MVVGARRGPWRDPAARRRAAVGGRVEGVEERVISPCGQLISRVKNSLADERHGHAPYAGGWRDRRYSRCECMPFQVWCDEMHDAVRERQQRAVGDPRASAPHACAAPTPSSAQLQRASTMTHRRSRAPRGSRLGCTRIYARCAESGAAGTGGAVRGAGTTRSPTRRRGCRARRRRSARGTSNGHRRGASSARRGVLVTGVGEDGEGARGRSLEHRLAARRPSASRRSTRRVRPLRLRITGWRGSRMRTSGARRRRRAASTPRRR